MVANARAIEKISLLAERPDLNREFGTKRWVLDRAMNSLSDDENAFYKVRNEDGQFSDAREAIGFIPWMFDIGDFRVAEAWKQLRDPAGFWAPRGLTTAEQRHPEFRTHGTGTCEWDGAVWPFATSQTLTGLIKYLHGRNHPYVTKRDFFDAMKIYAASHTLDGKPYIGEYHDEKTGAWLITGPKAARSRDYNHSTFCDLVITGLVGLIPRDDNTVEVAPLIPKDAWEYFCLDNIPYHGQTLTIVWDESGAHYNRGQGLTIYASGQQIANSPKLSRLRATIPARN
jgi:mannosylglycerate hydrolase MGH1-like protein/glycosyl hydrolase family 65